MINTLFHTPGIKSLPRRRLNTADTRATVKVPGEESRHRQPVRDYAKAATGEGHLYTLRMNEGEERPATNGPVKAGSKAILKPCDPKADAGDRQLYT